MANLIWADPASQATHGQQFWTGTGGDVAVESTIKKYGIRSTKIGPADSSFAYKAGIITDAGRRITGWFRFASLPAGTGIHLHIVQTAGSLFVMALRLLPSGVLQLEDSEDGTTKDSSGSALVVDTWYRITLSFAITATNNWDAKVYVNGALVITASEADFNLDRVAAVDYLPLYTAGGESCTAYVSPVVVDDGTDLADPGDLRCIHAPYAAESTNNFDTAIGAARDASDYTNVNERPLSETNGWQHAALTQVAESYTIEQTLSALDVDLTGKTIAGRVAWIWAKRGSSTFTPVTHKAAVSGTGNTTTGGTMVIPTVATDDFLVVVVTSQGSTSGSANVTCTDNDSGGNAWTTVTNTADKKAWMFAKRATSATTGKTITIANGVTKTAFGMEAFQGAATSLTVLNTIIGVTTETNASGDETHATFTPAVGGCAIGFSVHDYSAANDASAQSTASLGAMTERVSHLPAGAGADSAVSLATINGTDAAAAATGSITWAQTNGTTYSTVFAVRPEETWAAAAVKLINNGSDVAKTLTTTSALYTDITTSATYPTGAFGMKSSGNSEDTFFYEGGCLVVWLEALSDITATASVTFSTVTDINAQGKLAATAAPTFSTAAILTAAAAFPYLVMARTSV